MRISLEKIHRFPHLTPARGVGVGDPNFLDRKMLWTSQFRLHMNSLGQSDECIHLRRSSPLLKNGMAFAGQRIAMVDMVLLVSPACSYLP